MILQRTNVADALASRRGRVVPDAETVATARSIVEDVRSRGRDAVLDYAQRFGDGRADKVLLRDDLDAGFRGLPKRQQELLIRTHQRIRAFAEAQRSCLQDLDVAVPGGRAGHTFAPIESAGCYAPGGRYPLPSSVLMTVTPARVAGVRDVTVASPNPAPITIGAAHVAGADRLIQVGGAHGIAALAFGSFGPHCDVIVGPGNRFVSEAKRLLAGELRIDMVAGPSELMIVADASARAEWIAADLIAQAEHDTDARVVLVSRSEELVADVDRELERQLAGLTTQDVARASLRHGMSCVVDTDSEAVALCNAFAPEHLQLMLREPMRIADQLRHYGALFVGARSAEVFGDYGIGPNHVLPTGQTARFDGGLSVETFLRMRSWLNLGDTPEVAEAAVLPVADTVLLAQMEGLEGHARAAAMRNPTLEEPDIPHAKED